MKFYFGTYEFETGVVIVTLGPRCHVHVFVCKGKGKDIPVTCHGGP
jgi:hypothetical protein